MTNTFSDRMKMRNFFVLAKKIIFVLLILSIPYTSFRLIHEIRAANNNAPVFAVSGDETFTIDEGEAINITGTVSDQDGDNLTCDFWWGMPETSDQGCTTGSTITYHFDWTPAFNEAGQYDIFLDVYDGIATSRKIITINVNDTLNDPPVYDSFDTSQTFNTREKVVIFDINVADSNGDAITCSIESAPTGSTFSTGMVQPGNVSSYINCKLEWTPTLDQVGDFSPILTISDGIDPVVIPIQLHVDYALNTAPTLSITGPQSITIKEDEALVLNLISSDSNPGDTIVLGVSNPPTYSQINQTEKKFLWRPAFDQAGEYNLEFTSTDGIDTTKLQFKITVEENGAIPVQSGAEAVLVLVNKNSPDSVAIGEYYLERRNVPSNQILELDTSTEEGVTMATYESQIRNPIKNYLDTYNLKNKIRYIVPTYGVPARIYNSQADVDNVRQARLSGQTQYAQAGYAVDSYLADLYDTLTSSNFYNSKPAANNPYWKGSHSYYNFYQDGFHFQPSHLSSNSGIYLVSRLDGASLKIAKGLVDKAIYAGEFTGPSENNQAYAYYLPYYSNAGTVVCGLMEKAGYDCTKEVINSTRTNPIWLSSSGNDYSAYWGEWRPGAIPLHFQSYTAPYSIRDTKALSQYVTATMLAADATATMGTVTEPLATGLPQPTAFFDYFLNGDGTEKHFNFAESIYMSSPVLKWTNIIIGDPLYKLSETPKVDTVPPKIENLSSSCSNNKATISWDNLTASDGSPEVSHGSVEYGLTSDYGTEIWDDTTIESLSINKKNYLSQHRVEISDLDCTKEYYVRVKATDPENNTTLKTFILNQVPDIHISSPADGSEVLDTSITLSYTLNGEVKTKSFNNLNVGENTLDVTETNPIDPTLSAKKSIKVVYRVPVNLSQDRFSTSWNMISFADLSAAITDKTLLPGTFKIRKYDPGTNAYIKGESSDITLSPGVGYWLKVDDVSKIVGLKYALNQTTATETTVAKGWNLLGNPFQADLPLSNLTVRYKDGTTRSYADAITRKEVAGYVWSWEASIREYLFVAINPERYATSAKKQTVINPFRGFWMIVRSDQISNIIMNR